MNGYDFDKTIYPRDSATDFWLFCVKRHPAAFFSAFRAVKPLLKAFAGRLSRGEVKEKLYSCLRRVPDPEGEVKAFWDAHIGEIYPWYLAQRREDDLVISASPAFLVGEACARLGVRCIATEMDPATGIIAGENCRGEEKTRRYRLACGEASLEAFYSDSLSDRPMMGLAESAYLMKNGRVARCVRSAGQWNL